MRFGNKDLKMGTQQQLSIWLGIFFISPKKCEIVRAHKKDELILDEVLVAVELGVRFLERHLGCNKKSSISTQGTQKQNREPLKTNTFCHGEPEIYSRFPDQP